MRSLAGRRMLRRVPQLLIGLFLYGIGIAFIVRGVLGAAPWDVLTQGIATHLPPSFGTTHLRFLLSSVNCATSPDHETHAARSPRASGPV